ncbi:MAG: GFA family protein [Myxococcales bacterium]|nr:GFA family protein [Myxococcales bacterium]
MELPQTFRGSCHCGAITFRVTLRSSVVLDCNCSVCRKKGILHAIVPLEDFERLPPGEVRGTTTATATDDPVTTYAFNTGIAKHTFCYRCGVQPFYTPRSHPDMVDVNPRCLDDVPLGHFDIRPFDGSEWERNVETIR